MIEKSGKKLLACDIPPLKISPVYPGAVIGAAAVPAVTNADETETAALISREPHTAPPAGTATALSRILARENTPAVLAPLPDGQGLAAVFAFDEIVSGYFRLDVTAPAGTIIDLAYDDELENDRVIPHRYPDGPNYKSADRYFSDGSRREYGSTILEKGFRYVQVVFRNFSAPVTVHGVGATNRLYPFTRTAQFRSNDFLLNKVYDLCLETMRKCTTDTVTDCPWRERAFWVNDMIVENAVTLQAFGDPRLNARCLRLACSNRRADGLIPGVCPDTDEPGLVLIPTNLFLILMLEDYLLYSGDTATVKELLPEAAAVLEIFRGWEDVDGLVTPPEKYWNFFDWSYELNDINMNGRKCAPLNWLYCRILPVYDRLCAVCDLPHNASAAAERAAAIAAACDRTFYDPVRQRYVDWRTADGSFGPVASQLSQALALVSGFLPEERRTAVLSALERDELLIPELYLHSFLFAAWRENRRAEPGLARIRRYWGHLARIGLAAICEAGVHQVGKAAFGNAGSMCHGFATAPVSFAQTTLLGIVPTAPGFREFVFDPQPGDLTELSGSVPVPTGEIRVRWQRQDHRLDAELTVPEGTVAVCRNQRYESGFHRFSIEL